MGGSLMQAFLRVLENTTGQIFFREKVQPHSPSKRKAFRITQSLNSQFPALLHLPCLTHNGYKKKVKSQVCRTFPIATGTPWTFSRFITAARRGAGSAQHWANQAEDAYSLCGQQEFYTWKNISDTTAVQSWTGGRPTTPSQWQETPSSTGSWLCWSYLFYTYTTRNAKSIPL